MLSKLEKDALWGVVKEIKQARHDSMGEYDVEELFERAIQKHQLTPEQTEYLKIDLIKQFPSYRG